ncbi:hypothetical protein BD770DRAFT_413872 [Pilaira anomala]|nr:hypothetical protein BD770DRAFT_413872 [Pilaira anomala]
MFCPFDKSNDEHKQDCNANMSKVRISAEWEFTEVRKYFLYFKTDHMMKVQQDNLFRAYILSTVFKNMVHCARGRSSTGIYFGLRPPVFENYFRGLQRDKIEGEDRTPKKGIYDIEGLLSDD